jgi:hypothetical protein
MLGQINTRILNTECESISITLIVSRWYKTD